MLNGENIEEEKKQAVDTFIMRESLIKDYIDEPHQRLLYEYDFLNMHTFYIELLSVYKQKEDSMIYPRCTRSKGELKEEVAPTIEEEDEGLTDQLLKDFNELLDDTFDYKSDSENSN